MEIVEILQLVLLLGLILSIGFLLLNVRKARPPHDMPESGDETNKQEMRLRSGLTAPARLGARMSVGQ